MKEEEPSPEEDTSENEVDNYVLCANEVEEKIRYFWDQKFTKRYIKWQQRKNERQNEASARSKVS
jgi:hypothetical protein